MANHYIIKLEDINEEIARGLYGDLEVLFMKSNDYISATKLCNYSKTKYGHKKEFRHWLELESSLAFIIAIEKEYHDKDISKFLIDFKTGIESRESATRNIIENCSSIILCNNLANGLRGYYIDELVAVQAAQWLSPSFAIRISKMYRDYARVKYEYEVNKKAGPCKGTQANN